MFYALFAVMLVVAFVTSLTIARCFVPYVQQILERSVSSSLAIAWRKYFSFAMVVIGMQGGVRVWELEKYLVAAQESQPFGTTAMRWLLEIYRTFIDTAQSCAWLVVLFLLAALLLEAIIPAITRRLDE